MKNNLSKFIFAITLIVVSQSTPAALIGSVTAIWLDEKSDQLMFKINAANSTTVCPPGNTWYGFNLAVPTSHPRYPYIYGLIMASFSKSEVLYLEVGPDPVKGYCMLPDSNYGIMLTK